MNRQPRHRPNSTFLQQVCATRQAQTRRENSQSSKECLSTTTAGSGQPSKQLTQVHAGPVFDACADKFRLSKFPEEQLLESLIEPESGNLGITHSE